MNPYSNDTYSVHVIQAWDDASAHFKKAAIEANKKSLANESWLLNGNRLLVPATATIIQKASQKTDLAGHEIQTDGVGTKVRIYMKAFNSLYEKYRANKTETNKEQLEVTARDLFYRMLLDLYAMNVDDFRNGDVALAVSDILDIDHITLSGEDKEQGEIFCIAFAHAIGRVIETTKIACVAGETAILWDGDKLNDTRDNLGRIVDKLLWMSQTASKITSTGQLPVDVELLVIGVKALIEEATCVKEKQTVIDRSVELNLGWSTTGYRNGEKLIPLEAEQVVIALFENKTSKGIISPRANGISAIRASMEKLLGKEWATLTLQDYFDTLDAKLIPIDGQVKLRLSQMWLDTPLWDIATGETTVFNPLVAGTLLGGIEHWPLIPLSISWQIHVTGNPVGKWSDVVADSGLGIDIDYSGIEIPQIIEMCMIAERQSFADGMKKFNMGIPYALVCSQAQAKRVVNEIWFNGYSAKIVGKITKPDEQDPSMINIKYPDGNSFSSSVAEVRK